MTTEYKIAAIPTLYKGVQFRSRLEAKWARFFDLLGWRWDYEPIDLKGWIPDFVIHGKKERVLVEVKPVFDFPEKIAEEVSRQARRSGATDDILLLGATILDDGEGYWPSCPAFGWLGEWNYPSRSHAWGRAIPHTEHELGFCHDTMGYHNRITGFYDGDSGAGSEYMNPFIRSCWNEASNSAQWNSPVNGEQIAA